MIPGTVRMGVAGWPSLTLSGTVYCDTWHCQDAGGRFVICDTWHSQDAGGRLVICDTWHCPVGGQVSRTPGHTKHLQTIWGLPPSSCVTPGLVSTSHCRWVLPGWASVTLWGTVYQYSLTVWGTGVPQYSLTVWGTGVSQYSDSVGDRCTPV